MTNYLSLEPFRIHFLSYSLKQIFIFAKMQIAEYSIWNNDVGPTFHQQYLYIFMKHMTIIDTTYVNCVLI